MTPELLGPAAASMGVVMAMAPLLQLRQMLLRRSADDISATFLVVIAIGAAAYCAYGLALGDLHLVIPNAIGVLTNVAAVAVTLGLRRKTASTPGKQLRLARD